MDFDSLINGATSFFRDQTLWAVLALALVGSLVLWKPKGAVKLALAGLALGAVVYVFAFVWDLTSQGIDDTEKFTATPDVKVD